MAREDVDQILNRVEKLALDIEASVPTGTKNIEFRADLAGLLVVAIAASYESCVKETLVTYASRHHLYFGNFAQNHFDKLNSRINMADLYKYARTFDNLVHKRFGEMIKVRKDKLNHRLGQDFLKSYDQILKWRHDFAHAGTRNTTVEEALATHRYAKRVLYCFDAAFDT